MSARILVVEDDAFFAESAAEVLGRDGLAVDIAPTLADARSMLVNQYDVLVVDYELPDGVGTSLAEEARQHVAGARLVLVTGRPALANAVEALRAGIDDYLAKPIELESLRLAVLRSVRAQEEERLAAVEHYRRRKLVEQASRPAIGAASARLEGLLERANRTTSPVLLQGETGTGKTRLAQRLHASGPRASGPFLTLNCGAVSESLIEAELFGHERGAFTGAVGARPGVFELAQGGTLLLDEIAELSLSAQTRLLSVIEDRTLRRVGGTVDRRVDVRIVAATHVDLRTAVAAKRFREDLRYRLEVLVIEVPPLRERRDEIGALVADWLKELGAGPDRHLAEGELAKLEAYRWPGNIRELRNVVERTLLLDDEPALRPSRQLAARGARPPVEPEATLLPDLPLDQLERRRILEAVEAFPETKARAASALGISIATLRRKLREMGVAPG